MLHGRGACRVNAGSKVGMQLVDWPRDVYARANVWTYVSTCECMSEWMRECMRLSASL